MSTGQFMNVTPNKFGFNIENQLNGIMYGCYISSELYNEINEISYKFFGRAYSKVTTFMEIPYETHFIEMVTGDVIVDSNLKAYRIEWEVEKATKRIEQESSIWFNTGTSNFTVSQGSSNIYGVPTYQINQSGTYPITAPNTSNQNNFQTTPLIQFPVYREKIEPGKLVLRITPIIHMKCMEQLTCADGIVVCEKCQKVTN